VLTGKLLLLLVPPLWLLSVIACGCVQQVLTCIPPCAGKLLLRESAMINDGDKAAFEDITKHKFFNTNNLWVNLPALQQTMEANHGMLPLPLIKNKKTVNPRDSSSAPVFQLETAMGSAIECFDGASAVLVPRKRFAPVKTCGDLFCLRSDAYTLTPSSTVELVCKAQPTIKLDDRHYKLVDKMEALVEGYPSMLECDSLKVSGPVKFKRGVAIKGKVEVMNGGSEPAELGAGEYANTKVDVGVKVPAKV
jgi:UDP-N-acetylglucosamine pyrophosphorylase